MLVFYMYQWFREEKIIKNLPIPHYYYNSSYYYLPFNFLFSYFFLSTFSFALLC
nr:MAG TPA: hypothetical protein [Caudoviricetes sp.]